MAKPLQRFLIITGLVLGLTPVYSSQSWLEDNDCLIKPPALWITEKPLEEFVQPDQRYSVDILLAVLHVQAENSDKQGLTSLGQIALDEAKSGEYLDVSLICKKAGLISLAHQAGDRAIQNEKHIWQLAMMVKEFHQAKLGDLCTAASQKTSTLFLKASDLSEGRYAAQVLLQVGAHDRAEHILNHCVQNERYWPSLLESYLQLKALQKQQSAQVALTKTLSRIADEVPHRGAGWFLNVAQSCMEQGYRKDSEQAASLALQHGEGLSQLIGFLKIFKQLGFKDLTDGTVQKIIETFRDRPSTYDLASLSEKLAALQEQHCYQKLCEAALPEYKKLHDFTRLIELVAFLQKHHEYSLREKAIQRILHICQPRELMCTFYAQSIHFLDTATCLNMTAMLCQDYDQADLAWEAAHKSVDCALAEFYESPEEFINKLGDLVQNFTLLEYPMLANRVESYKQEALHPSIRTLPKTAAEMFGIYWTNLEGAQGCEINKVRPCIVVSRSTSYTAGNNVLVLPLSTKLRVGTTSIPIFFNDQEQQARLDQARSVDTTRLIDFMGILADQYKPQIRLGFQNFLNATCS